MKDQYIAGTTKIIATPSTAPAVTPKILAIDKSAFESPRVEFLSFPSVILVMLFGMLGSGLVVTLTSYDWKIGTVVSVNVTDSVDKKSLWDEDRMATDG